MKVLQAILLFWFGGASAFAALTTVWLRTHEDNELDEFNAVQLALGTFFWPWSIFQAYAAFVEQNREREKKRKREPEPEREPLAVIPAPPECCETCTKTREAHQQQLIDLAQSFPPLCDQCSVKFKSWQDKYVAAE